MSKKLTNKEFIEKAVLKWGHKYDYSGVEYKNDRTPVQINCPIHGIFNQAPNVHYRSECPCCGEEKRARSRKKSLEKVIDSFIKKHGYKYDYSRVKYHKMREPVRIRCKFHNVYFSQSPEKHLISKNGGCIKCNSIGGGIMPNELFIEKSRKIHGYVYDYSSTNYIKSDKNITLICKIHGPFRISPNSNLKGAGCQKCSGNYKYKISDLLEIFNNLYKNYVYDFSNYRNVKTKILASCPIHSYFETTAELLLKGYGCARCSRKSIGEELISKYLNKNNIKYIAQKSFDGCVYKNKMKFDFYIPKLNTCPG
jgi:hypothetical protein